MSRNKFTITPSGANSVSFVVQYVGSAVIKKWQYQLGIFDFNIVDNTDKINVSLDEAGNVIYSVVDTTPSKIVMQAEKDGIIQTLELSGGRVTAVRLNSFDIFVN